MRVPRTPFWTALRGASAALLAATPLAGCAKGAPIREVDDRPFASGRFESRAAARKHVERTARLLGWQIDPAEGPDVVIRKRKRRHVAIARVRFDRERFSVTYEESIRLLRDEGRIHPVYNRWVLELARSLERGPTGGQ